MRMANSSAPTLTTSRIVRLFRPLRAKCKHLVSVLEGSSKRRHSAPITYTSRKRLTEGSRKPGHPPQCQFSLTPLPPPQRLRDVGQAGRETLPLSKALYDVRDAFQNILSACFTPPSEARAPKPLVNSRRSFADSSVHRTFRVPSLAVLAATVIGRTIEAEVWTSLQTVEKNLAKEDGDVAVINQIYDSVPQHHRL